jgi:hypothetical protein
VYYQVSLLKRRLYSLVFSNAPALNDVIFNFLVPFFVFTNNVHYKLVSFENSNLFDPKRGCYHSVENFLLQSLSENNKLILSFFRFNETAFYQYILSSKNSILSGIDLFPEGDFYMKIQEDDLSSVSFNIDIMRYSYSRYSDHVINTSCDIASESSIQAYSLIINSPGLPVAYLFSDHAITFMLQLTNLLSQPKSDSDRLLMKKYHDLPIKILKLYFSALEMHFSMTHEFVLPYKLSFSFYSLLLSSELFFHNAILTEKSLRKGLLYYLHFYSNYTFRSWLEQSLDSKNNFTADGGLIPTLSQLFDLNSEGFSVDLFLIKLDALISQNDFIAHHMPGLQPKTDSNDLSSSFDVRDEEDVVPEMADVVIFGSDNLTITVSHAPQPTENTLQLGC